MTDPNSTKAAFQQLLDTVPDNRQITKLMLQRIVDGAEGDDIRYSTALIAMTDAISSLDEIVSQLSEYRLTPGH